MKIPWNRKPKLKEKHRYLSSNDKYSIIIYEDPSIVRLYATQDSSLYDLADTIYNDCIINLNISIPFKCYVIFYRSINYESTIHIRDCQSIEDVLKEIS